MLENIKQIWNDETLYGHSCTSITNTLWDFATTDELYLYTKPELDPEYDARFPVKNYFNFLEGYVTTKKNPDGRQIISNKNQFTWLKYSEICFRKLIGTSLAIGSSITIAPLGLGIKAVQKL